MMRRDKSNDEAQMLLATGVVLLLALLSMAIYSVKVVGMGEPYDASDDAVLQTAEEVSDVWETSIQHRFDDLNGTENAEEKCLDAANSVKADLMRHGEHRSYLSTLIQQLNPISVLWSLKQVLPIVTGASSSTCTPKSVWLNHIKF